MSTFDVPQLLNSKSSGYLSTAPKLEVDKFTKWKKWFLCRIVGMEPYLLKCLNDGLYVPKTITILGKIKAQWIDKERKVVNQDQCLKSIIISCIPNDVIESVIGCPTAKQPSKNLILNFEGPYKVKENRVVDLKLA